MGHAGHHIEMTPTGERAIHSSRMRYRVVCHTCDEVLHQGTTGPVSRAQDHLRDYERMGRAVGALQGRDHTPGLDVEIVSEGRLAFLVRELGEGKLNLDEDDPDLWVHRGCVLPDHDPGTSPWLRVALSEDEARRNLIRARAQRMLAGTRVAALEAVCEEFHRRRIAAAASPAT
jgi:hypothetical protein